MSFKVTEEGIVELRLDLGQAALELNPETRTILAAYAQKIRSDAINSMRRSTAAGQSYTFKIKGRKKAITHRASAPGQPPAIVTGRLWNSITVDSHQQGMVLEVGPTVFYGKYLETGTEHMDERPFMLPALNQNVDPLAAALANAIRSKLQG